MSPYLKCIFQIGNYLNIYELRCETRVLIICPGAIPRHHNNNMYLYTAMVDMWKKRPLVRTT